MHRRAFFFSILFAACCVLRAQWAIQDSGTDADLHGVDVDGGVAWVSGTNGTVLRSEDGGYSWQKCAVPPGAEHLDFRGIQSLDGNTAIVMSSGKGDLSRLYETTDQCHKWKLILRNFDKEVSWDVLYFDRHQWGWLLGNPARGRFTLFYSEDRGRSWLQLQNIGLEAEARGQDVFAVSNSSITGSNGATEFGTGGSDGAFIYSVIKSATCVSDCSHEDLSEAAQRAEWAKVEVPIGKRSASSGIFSMAEKPDQSSLFAHVSVMVAVGGDSSKPDDTERTAAFTTDGGKTWHAAEAPPHGFRSAVVYDAPSKIWIAVGPNGTDISSDDGRNWRALHPNKFETPDADRNWNAIALPFAVGPHGRIGKLNHRALLTPAH